MAPIACNPRNHEQALRQESASVPESPACHCLAVGQSLVRGFSVPCQALAPLVPQFPWQELLLIMRPATWEVLVNTGRQRGAGVGNRWNSRARRKGWRQRSHRLHENKHVALFTSSFIFWSTVTALRLALSQTNLFSPQHLAARRLPASRPD